jgi:hypothetical protein
MAKKNPGFPLPKEGSIDRNKTFVRISLEVEIGFAVRGGAIVGHGAAAFCGCVAE